MNSIGIFGQGYVGTALREGMKHEFDIYTYDKKTPYDILLYNKDNPVGVFLNPKIKNSYGHDLFCFFVTKCDGPIFICVPTPMEKDGSCDISIVKDVIKRFDEANFEKTRRTIVIKSTVIPGTTEKLNEAHSNIHVCFNPEFLTERNAIDDFKNQNRIIVGGPHKGASIVKQMYNQCFPKTPVTKTSSTIAEMIKYITNCFLATKVSFANEIKQICNQLEIDYDKVIEYATKDERLGTSHWAVPGPVPSSDGSGKLLLGFGNACFPKDLNALISQAKELGIDPKVMNAVWEKNLEVRPEKDWEHLTGRAIVNE